MMVSAVQSLQRALQNGLSCLSPSWFPICADGPLIEMNCPLVRTHWTLSSEPPSYLWIELMLSWIGMRGMCLLGSFSWLIFNLIPFFFGGMWVGRFYFTLNSKFLAFLPSFLSEGRDEPECVGTEETGLSGGGMRSTRGDLTDRQVRCSHMQRWSCWPVQMGRVAVSTGSPGIQFPLSYCFTIPYCLQKCSKNDLPLLYPHAGSHKDGRLAV